MITDERYKRIIDLPHHTSDIHPPMSADKRAAQFAPFAALTGYGDGISEAGRYTSEPPQIDGDEKADIERKLNYLLSDAGYGEVAEITYFVPDEKKSGGSISVYTGTVFDTDGVEGKIVLSDRSAIAIDRILRVSCESYDNATTDI